jgi:MerR family transcriptional regulator/heat shock protein HspR
VGKRKRTSAIAPGRAVFTPSIASEILNLHPRTLMIYESENLIKPQRTATNRRRYSEDDIRRVRVIQFLTRQKGVNLAGVKYVLRLLQSLGNQGHSTRYRKCRATALAPNFSTVRRPFLIRGGYLRNCLTPFRNYVTVGISAFVRNGINGIRGQ